METLFDERSTLFNEIIEAFPTVCFIQVSCMGKTQSADKDLRTNTWEFQDVYDYMKLMDEIPLSEYDKKLHCSPTPFISVKIGIPLVRYVHRFLGMSVELPLEKLFEIKSMMKTHDTSIEGVTAERTLKMVFGDWIENTSYYRYLHVAKERCDEYKEELMATVWKPSRVEVWLKAGCVE